MSYDILFVPRRPDQAWQEALDAAEGTDVLTVAIGPERREQWARIVTSLRRRLGEVEESVADDTLEATHVASGLQVSLFPDEAALTFPYWERPDVPAFHDQVVDVVGLVESETGLSAWDAQSDAPFDGTIHDEAGVSASARLTRSGGTVPGPVPTGLDSSVPDVPPGPLPDEASDRTANDQTSNDRTTGDQTSSDHDAQPSSQPSTAVERRRALRYVVLGLIIIGFALLLRAQGQSTTLSGLALAVGVADILIGALMWRSYRRREEQPR